MVSIPGVSPFVMWGGFLLLVAIFLFLDLGVFNKKKHAISIKEALLWTCVWVFLALCFNAFIWWEFGHDVALQFFAGYLLEKSLSVDNIFVIFIVFASFKIEAKYQHKILFWGIVGALVLRGIFIGAGTALIARFDWILYIFGAFLVYTGIHMVLKDDDDFDPHESWVVRFVHRIVHVTRDHKDGKLWYRHDGKIVVTILFVALLVVEVTDVAFAFDSIPAIFGITLDPFIVFTSNIFAILGLRSLYFVVAKLHDMFVYLNYGLAAILVFIGVKMLVEKFLHIPLVVSLGVVFGVLFVSITASVIHARLHPERHHKK